jgi:hypothetical protein
MNYRAAIRIARGKEERADESKETKMRTKKGRNEQREKRIHPKEEFITDIRH